MCGNEAITSDEKLSRDVFKILQRLYGVVVALAITTAIGLTISTNGIALSPFELNIADIALFGAFFVTIVPFYHGGSMYLLKNYIHGSPPKKKGVALVDFLALTFEGVVFYAIAASITNLISFEIWFIILLVLDTFWLGFAYLATDKENPAPKFWVSLNGAMLVFMIIIYGISSDGWSQVYSLVFVATVIRTVLDYAHNYHFYFPLKRKAGA